MRHGLVRPDQRRAMCARGLAVIEPTCICTHDDHQTVLCAEHWDWLMDYLDAPPTESRALRDIVRMRGERKR